MKTTSFLFLLFFLTPLLWARPIGMEELQNKWSGSFGLSEDGHYSAQIAGAEAPSYIEKRFEVPLSLSQKFIRVKMKVSDLSSLQGIELRLTSQEEGYSDFYSIAIPLFTDPQFNIVQSDSWFTYTFTLGEARVHGNPNLDEIVRLGFYLGGEDVEIAFKELSIEESFPQAVVSFTFDDSYDDHFVAAEIMADYNIPGTAYIMPRQINEKNYLTTSQLRIMAEDLGWDLSSHHKTPIVDFPYHELDNEFNYTLGYLNALGSTESARHFAYPLGKQDRKQTLPLIRRTFDTARIAGGGAETLPPADWHMLRTFNVMPNLSAEDILARVQKAKEQGEWLILMFHYIVDEENPTDPLAYNKEEFAKLCRLLYEDGVSLMSVNEVYQNFQR